MGTATRRRNGITTRSMRATHDQAIRVRFVVGFADATGLLDRALLHLTDVGGKRGLSGDLDRRAERHVEQRPQIVVEDADAAVRYGVAEVARARGPVDRHPAAARPFR